MRAPVLPAAALSLLLIVSLAACSDQPPEAPPPRPVMVAHPEPAQDQVQVFPGEVRAREEPALAFRVAGKIARRLASTGARVEAGALLAELDRTDLDLQVQAVQAQLAAAEAEQELARAERDRHARMLERQLVSQSLFDARQATLESAEARVSQIRAQLAAVRNQLDYAYLRAPQAGVITARHAEAGQVVAAGQAIFTLAADGERDVVISIPELQISRFALGQPVFVELWSQGGRHWPGTVRELAASADPQARTFAAKIRFQPPGEQGVELGQSARVYLFDPRAGQLAVPLSAVGGEAGQAHVFVVDPAGSRARRRAVEVVAWGERDALIEGSLRVSDRVVIGGVHLLSDGQLVKAVDRDNRALGADPQP